MKAIVTLHHASTPRLKRISLVLEPVIPVVSDQVCLGVSPLRRPSPNRQNHELHLACFSSLDPFGLVALKMVMTGAGGWSATWWAARLRGQPAILRLMTPGLDRRRRGGRRRSRSSAWVALIAWVSLPGGKRRQVDDLAAHDAQ